jgi:AraC-like DNA-binding protein
MAVTFAYAARLPRMASKMGIARLQEDCETLRTWRSSAFDGIVFSRGSHFRHPFPRHWHEEIHFCAYTAGSGYLGYRGESHLVRDGDFVITPPGEVHENWVASDSHVSFCGAYIDFASFRKATENTVGCDLPLPQSNDLFCRDLLLKQRFLRLLEATERRDLPLQQEELLLEFLHALLLNSAPSASVGTRTGNERAAVKRAREYMDEHFAETISLGYLGQLTNLSPYHVHRVFSRQIGMPPHAYQTQLRINRAKSLLRNGQALSDVAASTGFADQSHLTRHFRRLVGITPGRYLS